MTGHSSQFEQYKGLYEEDKLLVVRVRVSEEGFFSVFCNVDVGWQSIYGLGCGGGN